MERALTGTLEDGVRPPRISCVATGRLSRSVDFSSDCSQETKMRRDRLLSVNEDRDSLLDAATHAALVPTLTEDGTSIGSYGERFDRARRADANAMPEYWVRPVYAALVSSIPTRLDAFQLHF